MNKTNHHPIIIIGVMILFIWLKKKTLIYFFSILLAISLVVICASVKEAKTDLTAPDTEPVNLPLSNKTILIDSGHGGFDAGASVNNVLEKDINLSVSLKLRECLKEAGATVVMTREEDVSTKDESRKDGTSDKVSDMHRRKEMISESGADIFISIHMNKFPQSKYWGAQVFYAKTPENSKVLGENIQASLLRTLNDNNKRVAKQGDSSIYILKNAAVPSVIVECGFLSNPDELKKLQNNDYQLKLAWGITSGVCDYFQTISTP